MYRDERGSNGDMQGHGGCGCVTELEMTTKEPVICADPFIALGDEHHQTGNTIRILLAEDNPCDQELMLRMLRHMGFCADIARDGLEVIMALKRQSYDLILMDLEMPVIGGIAATRLIRLLWHERQIIIIAVTSRDQKSDRDACIEAGMDDFLCKPVKREYLDAILKCCPHCQLPRPEGHGLV